MNRLKRLETILKSKQVENGEPKLKEVAENHTQLATSKPNNGNRDNEFGPEARQQQSTSDDDQANFDRWDPMSEDYTSSKNTLTVTSGCDPFTSITGKIQPIRSKIGNVTICERFATYGECADGRFCERIHIDLQAREKIWALQNTYESNKGRTCMNFTYLSPIDIKPDPKALLLVSVASATSPSSFYVVAPFENLNFANLNQSDMEFYVDRIQQTSAIKKKIEQFHHQMADIFGHSYRVDNLNDDIYLSQIVGCKLKDGLFRRAMIVGLPDVADYTDVNYRLHLIDVGVEIELPRESIYDIKANTLSEPPLALNCRLDIKPANGALEWSASALAQFNNLIRQNRFSLCRVINHIKADRILTVDLLDFNTRVSYTDKLLSSGLAERCSR